MKKNDNETTLRIKQLCKENGITLRELEENIGEAQSSLSKTNSNMKAEKLYKIASFFNVSMEYIMCKDDIPTHSSLIQLPTNNSSEFDNMTSDKDFMDNIRVLFHMAPSYQNEVYKYIKYQSTMENSEKRSSSAV